MNKYEQVKFFNRSEGGSVAIKMRARPKNGAVFMNAEHLKADALLYGDHVETVSKILHEDSGVTASI